MGFYNKNIISRQQQLRKTVVFFKKYVIIQNTKFLSTHSLSLKGGDSDEEAKYPQIYSYSDPYLYRKLSAKYYC